MTVSREYAEALFALALERGEESKVLQNLKEVEEMIKENPEYMWAETMIYDRNMKHCSLEEIRAHIVETIDKYKPHHLVPCFFDIG